MANSKFVGRVISYQLDIAESTTELYKLILRNSNISIPNEIIDKFEFTFNPPKTLNTMNLSDVINNTDQLVQYMIKILTGENADQTQDSNRLKDKLYRSLAKYYLPMIDWVNAEKAMKEATIDLRLEDANNKVNVPNNNEM